MLDYLLMRRAWTKLSLLSDAVSRLNLIARARTICWAHFCPAKAGWMTRSDRCGAPQSWSARYEVYRAHLGNLYLGLDQPELAEAVFLDAVGLAPANAALHRGLSQALRRQNRLDEAMVAAQRAMTLNHE